jgi:hypothetical protein
MLTARTCSNLGDLGEMSMYVAPHVEPSDGAHTDDSVPIESDESN